MRFYKYGNLPLPTSPYLTLRYQHNLWVPYIHHRMAINFMLYYSVTLVVTGNLPAGLTTQYNRSRHGVGATWLISQRPGNATSPPQNTDSAVYIQSVRHCGHCWNGHKTHGGGCPVFLPSYQLTALTLGPKHAVWSLLHRLHCFLIYLSICKTLLVTEVISFGSSLSGWRRGGG